VTEGGAPESPTFATNLTTADLEGISGFSALLIVEVKFRFREEAVATIRTSTQGVFVKEGNPPPDVTERFRSADCAVLLWPYARAHVSEVARMMDIDIPPLPTIDVRLTLEGLHPPQPEE
jgi:Preprotein translocase subunit SecB.